MHRDLTFIIGENTTFVAVKEANKVNSIYFNGVKIMFHYKILLDMFPLVSHDRSLR